MAIKQTILHLSHTDIRCDSRILKELQALEAIENCELVGIGARLDEGSAAGINQIRATIHSIVLLASKLRFLPGALKNLLKLIELTLRMGAIGLRSRLAIVHCHDTLVLPAGVLIKWLSGCQLIYDAHELESEKNGQSKLLSRATLLIERLAWSHVDLLVSVSPSILCWYESKLGRKPNILILNSPVVEQGLPSLVSGGTEPRYFHRRFGIPAAAKVFLYLGIMGPGRGIERILEVFSRAGMRSHCVFVGYGSLVDVRPFTERCSNIHLHPAVPHEEVVGLVQSADFGLCLIEDVSLSDRLCLPNKLFEYAFAGIPVLSSNLPELRRVVTEYSLGVCCDASAESIAQAIAKLEAGPVLKRASSIADLSWPAQAERLVAAYETILTSRAASMCTGSHC